MTYPDSLTAAYAERWNSFDPLPERTLLRLALLRDLLGDFHAARSKCLALGEKEQARTLADTEKKIQTLRTAAKLDGALTDILKEPEKVRKCTRLLPDALFNSLPREKLDRYDREWEKMIAAEAISIGWRFWHLYARVEIAQLESWAHQLREQISPHGVILYAEDASESPADLSSTEWSGKWLITLKPHYLTPHFRVAEIGGTVADPPPQWKILYSPRCE